MTEQTAITMTEDEIENPNEKILRVKWPKEPAFYAIKDTYVDYYRTRSPIGSDMGWTKGMADAAKYKTKREARTALNHIWAVRRGEEADWEDTAARANIGAQDEQ
ncbi:MAG: hypothetical protein V2A79_14795 [Planctomycetota bacterium]